MLRFSVNLLLITSTFLLVDVGADTKITRQLQCSIKPIEGSRFKSAFCFNHWPATRSLPPEVVDLTIYAALVQKITLSMIVNTGLNLTAVTTLRFSKCKVENIESNSFTKLPSLETVDLVDNQLTSVSPKLFATNKHLSHLVLRSNRLKTIPAGLPQSLQQLDLADNDIEHIADNSPIVGLRHLNLCGNRIEDAANIAYIYPRLEVLCLGDNALAPRVTGLEDSCYLKELTLVGKNTKQAHLSTFILESFRKCSQLRELSIQYYQILSLAFLGWFRQLEKLELIQVHVNEALTRNLFKDCFNLSSINLSGSQKLTDAILYNKDIHQSMENISYLNVENCGLTDLKWLPLKSLTRLDISKNPFDCRDPITKQALCQLQVGFLKKSTKSHINGINTIPNSGFSQINVEHKDLIQCRVGTNLSPMNYSECSNLSNILDVTTKLPNNPKLNPKKQIDTNDFHEPSKNQELVWIICFAVFGAILLIIAITGFILVYRRKNQGTFILNNEQTIQMEEQNSS